MKNKKDIFDRLMSIRILRRFQPLYQQYKEVLLYLFFGGLTFLVSVGSYIFFESAVKIIPLIAILFSWILAVTFAYVTNRAWVFSDTAGTFSGIIKEIAAFFLGRAATLIMEEVILFLGITVIGLGSIPVKVAAQILVIISNYFISKMAVFNSKN